jgi:hypothetical protein
VLGAPVKSLPSRARGKPLGTPGAYAGDVSRVTLCEWSDPRCAKLAKPGSSYCAEHHGRVFQAPKPDQKRVGIGPLTKESILKAYGRRKAKLGRGRHK